MHTEPIHSALVTCIRHGVAQVQHAMLFVCHSQLRRGQHDVQNHLVLVTILTEARRANPFGFGQWLQ